MSNSHIHPVMQQALAGISQRNPIKQAEDQLKHQAKQIEQMRRLLDEQSQALNRYESIRKDMQKDIDSVAYPSFALQLPGQIEWTPIPQDIVLKGVERLVEMHSPDLDEIVQGLYLIWLEQEKSVGEHP